MALEGTLKDFSPFDIMELIDIKHKVGLLFVTSSEGETITLGFEEKGLLLAESSAKHLYMQLGTLLIKSGRITEAQRDNALELQKGTQLPLGYIIVREKYCTSEDICTSLRLQMKRAFFTLLRWTEGGFIFEPRESIQYHHELVDTICVKPLNVQGLLMEGAVMIDEWPMVEKIVSSLDMVVRHLQTRKKIEKIVEEEAIDFELGSRLEVESDEDVIKVSADEEMIYKLVDGHRSINDILYKTTFSEFSCCKIICELIKKGLIEEGSGTSLLPIGIGKEERYEADEGPSVISTLAKVEDGDRWRLALLLIQRLLPSANILEVCLSSKKMTCLQGTADVTLWSELIFSLLYGVSQLENGSQVGVLEYVVNRVGLAFFWDHPSDYMLVVTTGLAGSSAAPRFRSQIAAVSRIILD